MNEERIRVIIADDSTEFLDSAIQFFESNSASGIKIIKTAKNGLEATILTALFHPDILLMDIEMAKLNGFEATEIIKRLIYSPKIIIISIFASAIHEIKAKNSGADGFLSKIDFGEKIIPLIKQLTV